MAGTASIDDSRSVTIMCQPFHKLPSIIGACITDTRGDAGKDLPSLLTMVSPSSRSKASLTNLVSNGNHSSTAGAKRPVMKQNSLRAKMHTEIMDDQVPELAAESRRLRRKHFSEVGSAVAADSEGWPSVQGLMISTPLVEKGQRETMHEIEIFQRCRIAKFSERQKVIDHLKDGGIYWSLVATRVLNFRPLFPRVDHELVERGVTDKEFNHIFTSEWGGEMLRASQASDSTFGIKNAIVCDSWPWLEGLDTHSHAWFEPCKVIFKQDGSGISAAAIVTKAAQGLEEKVFLKSACSDLEWLWAKRMAMSSTLTMHQLQYHLTLGHLMVEAFVSLAYKHLHQDHFVFKFLEPCCADVGFINRSWGFEFIADLPRPSGKKHPNSLTDVLPLSSNGVLEAVKRAREFACPQHFFWFRESGYMKGACGVHASTPFEYRDTSVKIFDAILQFSQSVVQHFWKDDDAQLTAWWDAIWWGNLASARCSLTKASLSHLLATICFNATHRHDHAHSASMWRNHHVHVISLRHGEIANPSSYLPLWETHLSNRAVLSGLNNGSVENPLAGYREAFPELSHEAHELALDIDKTIASHSSLREYGSMTH